MRQEEIIAATSIAPVIVAADGGGDVPLPPGAMLRAVIGDLDSLRDPAALRDQSVAVHAVAEQDSTDLEKCLYCIDTPLFIGVGFLGGRVDHTLAALNALVKNPDKAVVLIGVGICVSCARKNSIWFFRWEQGFLCFQWRKLWGSIVRVYDGRCRGWILLLIGGSGHPILHWADLFGFHLIAGG